MIYVTKSEIISVKWPFSAAILFSFHRDRAQGTAVRGVGTPLTHNESKG